MSEPPRSPNFRHYFETFWWNTMVWPLGHLPTPLLNLASYALAVYTFDLLRFRRKITLNNLAIAFPEKSPRERRRIARQSYRHAVLNTAEFLVLTRPGALRAKKIEIEIEAENEVDLAHLTQERGFVGTLGHWGSWEFLPHYLAERGVKLAILYKPMHNPIMDEQFLRLRLTSQARYLSTRLDGRQLLRELKQAAEAHYGLIFLADQDARKDGIFVPFFGKNASTAAGPATLALRLNLPIIAAGCIRTGLWRFKLIYQPLIEPLPGGRTPENIQQMTALHVAALENLIRRAPEQYMWFHQRWKSSPRKKKQGTMQETKGT